MNTLYELTDQYQSIMNMLYDGETDEQLVMDTLESIDGEIEDKADNYAKIIRMMLADAEILKDEETRLYARRKSLEMRAQRMKDNYPPGTRIMLLQNLGEIPGKYLIPQPPVPDKEAIRQLLAEKEVDWAHLAPYGKHLNIR